MAILTNLRAPGWGLPLLEHGREGLLSPWNPPTDGPTDLGPQGPPSPHLSGLVLQQGAEDVGAAAQRGASDLELRSPAGCPADQSMNENEGTSLSRSDAHATAHTCC